jgi:hypothetical protein
MTDTSWIAEGARVAEYTQYAIDAHVTLTTIERLTATQIVLANGNRYNREKLRPVGGSGRTELLPATDSQVLGVLARRQIKLVGHVVHELTRNGAGRRVEEALSILDQIQVAVDEARRAIAAAVAG